MKPGYAKRRNDRIVRSGAAGPDAVEPMALVDCRLPRRDRSEEHTSELQSQSNLVCRLLLEKKKNKSHFATRSTLFHVLFGCCLLVLKVRHLKLLVLWLLISLLLNTITTSEVLTLLLLVLQQ